MFSYFYCSLGVDAVARLVCFDVGLDITACEAEVSHYVKQLVAAALVRETEFEVGEIALRSNAELRLAESLGHADHLALAYRLLHDNYGVLHVPAFYEAQGSHVLDFMEEAEGAARADLFDIVGREVPMCLLDTQDMGIEVYGDVDRRFVGRSDPDP